MPSTDVDHSGSKLRELAAAATPGPWRSDVCAPRWCVRRDAPTAEAVAFELSRDDAAYIAAVGPDVILCMLDALDDEIARQRDQLAAVDEAHAFLRSAESALRRDGAPVLPAGSRAADDAGAYKGERRDPKSDLAAMNAALESLIPGRPWDNDADPRRVAGILEDLAAWRFGDSVAWARASTAIDATCQLWMTLRRRRTEPPAPARPSTLRAGDVWRDPDGIERRLEYEVVGRVRAPGGTFAAWVVEDGSVFAAELIRVRQARWPADDAAPSPDSAPGVE